MVVEKLPFLALSAASSAITLLVQDTARVNPDDLPLSLRLGNAALSCAAYLRQTFWPTRLAVFYPYPADWPWGGLGVAVLLLLGITVAGLRLARRWPWGIVGWLWYLGMLVPVLGVVQVGQQARADRYSYLPLIGIFVVVSWGLGWAKAAGRGKKEEDRNQSSEVGGQKSEGEGRRLSTINYQPSTLLLSGGAIAVLAGLGVTAHWQVRHWQSSTTIFEHACRVTKDNYVAWGGLGVAEVQRGNWDRAVTYLNRALECPRCFTAADNCKYYLGLALQRQGKPLEALPYLQTGIVVPELWPDATYRLGLSLIATGRLAEAEVIVQKAIDARPRNPEFRLGMASLLRRQGKTADAIRQLDELLMLEPTNALVNLELAELLSQQGRKREAVARYDQALAADPKSVTVLNNLAWMLATDADDRVRNGPRAVELAQRACQLSEWKAAVLMGTLAAAYAEAGRFADAAAMAEKARDHARADKQEDVAKRNEELLERYRAGKPYHEER